LPTVDGMGRHAIRLRDRLRSRAGLIVTAAAAASTAVAAVGAAVLVDEPDVVRTTAAAPWSSSGEVHDEDEWSAPTADAASQTGDDEATPPPAEPDEDAPGDEASRSGTATPEGAASSPSASGEAPAPPAQRPAPTPTPTTPAPTPPAPSAIVQRGVLDETNAARATAGLPALGWSDELAARACAWAVELAAADAGLEHSSDGSGFSSWAENVASGYPSVTAVVAGWLGSDGHRANLLGGYAVMGACSSTSASGTSYWVQQFGA